jgi:hypothetical protein
MEQPYSTLLPMLGGWERRESRLAAPADWWVRVSFDHASVPRHFGSAVLDICPTGRGFHVALPAEIERCENGGSVDVTFKGGETVPVGNADVIFRFPDGSSLRCRARARRGWKYEVTAGVFKDFCGIVFVMDKPDDIAALKSRLVGLTDRKGMAAPPEKAPVPPVEPTPPATAAGTASQPRQGPSPATPASGVGPGQASEQQSPSPTSDGEGSFDTLPHRVKTAFTQYMQAKDKCAAENDGSPTDHECYVWAKGHAEDGELPAEETWQRYVRQAHKHLGTQKHSPRGGQAQGHSVIQPRDVAPTELIQLAGGTLPSADSGGDRAD